MKNFKLYFFLLSISTFFIFGANGIEINCSYLYYSSTSRDFNETFYYCMIQNPELITSKTNREITSARGRHVNAGSKNGRTNDDVDYILANNQTILYFPRNLTNVFKNIENIKFISTGLQENLLRRLIRKI